MTKNLNAVSDFEKGDKGRVSGYRVTRVAVADQAGMTLVTALQDVKAGMNGWFDDSPASK